MNFFEKFEASEPGTLFVTLFSAKDRRVLTETGEFLSDDEFDDLWFSGSVHLIQEEHYPDEPAIYEIAPATRGELQELFELTKKRVRDFQRLLIEAVAKRHVDKPQTEITCLDRETDRYEQITFTLKSSISREMDAYQQKHKHKRDADYSAHIVNFKRSLSSLMEVDFEVRISRTLSEATKLLQKIPDESWKSDDLKVYLNTLIHCRELLKEDEDNEEHPYLSLLAGKIFDSRKAIHRKERKILNQIPAKNLLAGPRRNRRVRLQVA